MTSSTIATVVAALALMFLEGFGRYYPTHSTWLRLRRVRGRRAVRAMRERFESYGSRKPPRALKHVLLGLVIIWVALWAAGRSLLERRWWELALDLVPYVIVYAAVVRTPGALGRAGERMKRYEDDAGDQDAGDETDEGGPSELAL